MGRKPPFAAVDLRPEYQRLGTWVRERRLERGVTQKVLAEALGKPEMFVSKVERGRQRLDVVEFMDVARILRLDHDAMFAELRIVVSGGA